MTVKPLPTRRRPARDLPSAPPHLEAIEAALWAELVEDYSFDGPGPLALLRSALEAHQRARRCRERIDADGEAVRDKWQQLKPHPLLAAERDARAAFLSAMKMLNLDIEIPPKGYAV